MWEEGRIRYDTIRYDTVLEGPGLHFDFIDFIIYVENGKSFNYI